MSILRDQLVPRRGFLLIDCVESQLETIGGAKLVENAEKIVSNGVFAEIQLARNVAVRASLRDQVDRDSVRAA